MSIGFIGLGKMGRYMAERLVDHGMSVVAYNRNPETTESFISALGKRRHKGQISTSYSVADLLGQLSRPRVVFMMVTAGPAVDGLIETALAGGLMEGDTLIDGGNSFYKDTTRRASFLKTKGIHYIDCGTSGGLEGGRRGACLMIGGDRHVVRSLSRLWDALAAPDSWAYMGPPGAGHFVKMIHNGIEYAFAEAIGEGLEIAREGPYDLDLAKVAAIWNKGSVIRGRLIELAARAIDRDPHLSSYKGVIGGDETGKWAVETAKDLGVLVPVIEESLKMREKSKRTQRFSGKVVSALRFEYGGHREENPPK